ncbi:hypothetical protein WISP_89499 [Willisornis vidua]|uniref:Reverse transcriptase domain-containing protein n=1 Tax=Willisornis vidua TaxID=1566151 RepID=A0ABQ9D1Y8_9PASS|nr:hypothetical protein WISP_89499 [Willisornis vidua]
MLALPARLEEAKPQVTVVLREFLENISILAKMRPSNDAKGFLGTLEYLGDTENCPEDVEHLEEVPEDLRKVNITPVFKKGKKKDPGSVHLTLIPGKMMQQLILEIICRLMGNKKIIRNSQHGFTKRKSCLINLITFYDKKPCLH